MLLIDLVRSWKYTVFLTLASCSCFLLQMMMQGCQHLCKYISTPTEARRYISHDLRFDLNKGQTRHVSSMGNSDASSLQQLLQLQAGGLGNILSPQVPRTQDSLSSSLALLSGQSSLPSALNPSLQLLGSNMQNRSAIASYLTELQLRQQQQQQRSGGTSGTTDGGTGNGGGGSGSGGGAGGGDGGLSGIMRGAQV